MLKYILTRISKIDNNDVWLTDKREYLNYVYLGNVVNVLRYCYAKAVSLNSGYFTGNHARAKPLVDGKRPVALRNIGLNCYLNSSFQSIVACTDFVREMKDLERRYPSSRTLLVFNKILHSLGDGHTVSDDDVELSSSAILRNWNRSGEQDTFEILSFVVFQVFNELRAIHQQRLPEKDRTVENWIRERLPLSLLIEFRIKCDCGYNFVPKLQSDLALHLPVPFRVYSDSAAVCSIERLLDNFFVPEKIADFACLSASCTGGSGGSGGGTITKSIVLQKPMPNTLCLHVQRTFWNPRSRTMEKNNEKISFSETLLIRSEFFTDERQLPDGPIGSAVRDALQAGDALATEGDHCRTSPDLLEVEQVSTDGGRRASVERLHNSITNTTLATSETVSSVSGKLEESAINGGGPEVDGESDTGSRTFLQGENLDTEDHHTTPVTGEDVVTPNTPKQAPIPESDWNGKETTNCNDIHSTGLNKEESIELNGGNAIYPDHSAEENLSNDNQKILTDINNDRIGDTPIIQQNTQITTLDSIENEQYHLKSVIVHFGRAESGHYICYRKCGNRWFCTNDNFITEVSFKEVQNSQAYILMYEKSL